MQEITKLCADSLRTFTNDSYGIKLKAAHAHELVAAYFGYQSKNAMLADTKYPVSNMRKAAIIVMASDASIDKRREELKELPTELPDSYKLGEAVYRPLFASDWWTSPYPPFRSFEKMAVFLADKHEQKRIAPRSNPDPLRESVRVEATDSGMLLTVSRFYKTRAQTPFFDVANEEKIITYIKLPRVAGHIGYGKHEITRDINVETVVGA